MEPDLRVRSADLGPVLMGAWDERTRTLWLHRGLSAVERHCTLVHELVHAERGDVACEDPVLDARQEHRVEQEAARRLIPWADLLDAVAWSADAAEVADLLGVDVATLDARLAGLDAAARGDLDARARRRG